MLPETTHRTDLLRECLAWIGEHYQLGDDPDAAHQRAVLETLGIPQKARTLVPEDWLRTHYDRALLAFREVIGLGLHYELHGWPDTHEAQVACAAWGFIKSIHQPDLSKDQLESSHIEAMVRGLTHWLVHTPGGLHDATQSLDRALKGA